MLRTPSRRRRVLAVVLVAALSLLATPLGAAGSSAGPRADHVTVPVDDWDRRLLSASWSAETGHPVVAPAGAARFRITLPAEVRELDLLPEEYVLEMDDPASWAWTYDGMMLDGFDVVVDVPTVTAALASRGWAAETGQLRLAVRSTSWRADLIHLSVRIDLVAGPAPQEWATALTLPGGSLLQDEYRFTTAPARAASGTTVVVEAPPGFWNEDASQRPVVWWWGRVGFIYADLTDRVVVSEDGSLLTVTLSTDFVHGERLVVGTMRDGRSRFSVDVPLMPPLGDPVDAYVDTVYRDLFGRSPDPVGLAGWGRALRTGTAYGSVANGITYSGEFRSGLITDSYEAYLGRGPDARGLSSWLTAMAGGMHIQDMESGFLASPEYYSRAGATDAGWVSALYRDVLGRSATSADVGSWVSATQRLGRRAVARQILYSTEHLSTVVDGYYHWLLHRGIDPVGRRSWVRALQGGHRSEEIVAGIVASAEYRNHVLVG